MRPPYWSIAPLALLLLVGVLVPEPIRSLESETLFGGSDEPALKRAAPRRVDLAEEARKLRTIQRCYRKLNDEVRSDTFSAVSDRSKALMLETIVHDFLVCLEPVRTAERAFSRSDTLPMDPEFWQRMYLTPGMQRTEPSPQQPSPSPGGDTAVSSGTPPATP